MRASLDRRASLSEALTELAVRVRETRRAAAAERARTAPVKMLFPLVLTFAQLSFEFLSHLSGLSRFTKKGGDGSAKRTTEFIWFE